MRRVHLTALLALLAAVGVALALGTAGVRSGGPGIRAVPAAQSPVPEPPATPPPSPPPSTIPELDAPLRALPPDPPEHRVRTGCGGTTVVGDREVMVKCGRG